MTRKDLMDFQKAHPTRESKERALTRMSNSQIDKLIAGCSTKQGKIFYSSHKKKA